MRVFLKNGFLWRVPWSVVHALFPFSRAVELESKRSNDRSRLNQWRDSLKPHQPTLTVVGAGEPNLKMETPNRLCVSSSVVWVKRATADSPNGRFYDDWSCVHKPQPATNRYICLASTFCFILFTSRSFMANPLLLFGRASKSLIMYKDSPHAYAMQGSVHAWNCWIFLQIKLDILKFSTIGAATRTGKGPGSFILFPHHYHLYRQFRCWDVFIHISLGLFFLSLCILGLCDPNETERT